MRGKRRRKKISSTGLIIDIKINKNQVQNKISSDVSSKILSADQRKRERGKN